MGIEVAEQSFILSSTVSAHKNKGCQVTFTAWLCRMSVVARVPDGTIRLYCKGADNIMIPRLRAGTDPGLLSSTQEHLRLYSVQVRSQDLSSKSILTS